MEEVGLSAYLKEHGTDWQGPGFGAEPWTSSPPGGFGLVVWHGIRGRVSRQLIVSPRVSRRIWSRTWGEGGRRPKSLLYVGPATCSTRDHHASGPRRREPRGAPARGVLATADHLRCGRAGGRGDRGPRGWAPGWFEDLGPPHGLVGITFFGRGEPRQGHRPRDRARRQGVDPPGILARCAGDSQPRPRGRSGALRLRRARTKWARGCPPTSASGQRKPRVMRITFPGGRALGVKDKGC